MSLETHLDALGMEAASLLCEPSEICPKCGGEDTYRAHADATASHPEVWYWNCEDCLIQWGHE